MGAAGRPCRATGCLEDRARICGYVHHLGFAAPRIRPDAPVDRLVGVISGCQRAARGQGS